MKIDLARTYRPHPRQIEFHKDPAKYRLFGGAMSGGKSYAGCAEGLKLSLKYPGNRGFIFRKNLTVLKRTTLITFFKICPPEIIRSWNKTDNTVTLINGSTIGFLEADQSKDPRFEKLRSLEMGWFFIDEASEVSGEAFRVLTTRLRWVLPNGKRPRYTGFLATNPEICWVKDRFIDQNLENHSFIPSLPTDNPYNPKELLDDMRSILSPEEQEKFLHGNWTVSNDPNQLIQYTWVRNCQVDTIESIGKQKLGVDVARYGNDQSVIIRLSDNAVLDIKSFTKTDTYQLAQYIETCSIDYGIDADRIVIDGVGIGAGVIDILRHRNLNVKEFIGGASPLYDYTTSLTFFNMRAQGYWTLRNSIKNGELSLPRHQKLAEDLTTVRYHISADKMIKVEPKEDIKKRIGRSPDYADALMMGYAGELLVQSSVVDSVSIF